MAGITRRFVIDAENIYFVSGHALLRESVFDFISHESNRIEDLLETGNNVGWRDEDTVLMVTEDCEIFRVDEQRYVEMLKDSETMVLCENDGGTLTIRYNPLKYPNEYLKADTMYKKLYPMKIGRCFVTSMIVGDGATILSGNVASVYTVHDGVVLKWNKRYGLNIHGAMWGEVVKNSDEHTGYLDDTDHVLLISNNVIKRASASKVKEMIVDSGTVVKEIACGINSYTVISYDTSKYTDEYLEATTDYKN